MYGDMIYEWVDYVSIVRQSRQFNFDDYARV